MADLSDYNHQDIDSNGARADFVNVLQGILDRANSGENFNAPISENGIDSPSTLLGSNAHDQLKDKESLSSPIRQSRKRRKKDVPKDDRAQRGSFIIKLFDRSVDLTKFNEDMPLYPICRAWMNNYPLKNNKSKTLSNGQKTSSDQDTDEDKANILYEMPPPDERWSNIDENGKYSSPRVPEPVPQPQHKPLDTYLTNESEQPSAESLLTNHLQHWKTVRGRWREKSAENDSRYNTGMTLLRDMFNRHNNFNSSSVS